MTPIYRKILLRTCLLIAVSYFFLPYYAFATCKVLVFGDSLTAGYGLTERNSFPRVLENVLIEKKLDVAVTNGGVSGDTTSSALARLEWQLFDKPDLIILELGANDMLRGLPNQQTKNNLRKILIAIKQRHIPTIFAGMKAAPNLGHDYTKEFNAIYPDLAEELDVLLYPFFLDGVAAQKHLNQNDGIHPNAQGIREIVVRFGPMIAEEIKKNCKSA